MHNFTEPRPQARALDVTAGALTILSNVFVGALFTIFAAAAFSAWQRNGHIPMLLLAAQEVLIVGLVVTRRRSVVETRAAWDWVLALAGTSAPLLQRPAPTDLAALAASGIGLQIVGAGLSVFATISLGRSFGVVAANRGVRTGGLYRWVRHPLYGSYMVGYIGFLLGNPTAWNLLLIATTFTCQYLRARAEERVLAQDPAYAAYMKTVRWRFWPHIF